MKKKNRGVTRYRICGMCGKKEKMRLARDMHSIGACKSCAHYLIMKLGSLVYNELKDNLGTQYFTEARYRCKGCGKTLIHSDRVIYCRDCLHEQAKRRQKDGRDTTTEA